jgi:hypothetical protein
MPEETQAPEAADEQPQDTPEAPEGGPDSGTPAEPEEHDYEKRYTDLRSDYDRKNQRLKQFEEFYGQLADPETQAEALRALGLELEDDEEVETDEEFEDPDARIERIEGYLSQQEEQRAEAELQELEEAYLEQEVGRLDAKLSEKEKEAVKNLAYSYEDEDGLPDVAAAYEVLSQASKEAQSRYLESKKAPKVEPGTAGVEKVDLNDEDARKGFLAALIEAEAQD